MDSWLALVLVIAVLVFAFAMYFVYKAVDKTTGCSLKFTKTGNDFSVEVTQGQSKNEKSEVVDTSDLREQI